MILLSTFLIATLPLIINAIVASPIAPLQRRGVQINGPGKYYLTNAWATTYTQTLSNPATVARSLNSRDSPALALQDLGSGGQVLIHSTWTLTPMSGGAENGNTLQVSTPRPAHIGTHTVQWDPAIPNQVGGILDFGLYNVTAPAKRDSKLPYGMEILYKTDAQGQLMAVAGTCYLQNGVSDASACDGAALYTEGSFAWNFAVQTTDGGVQFG